MSSEHVAHLQRMANESWIGSPERAALDAAIASLSAPQPPAEAQAVGGGEASEGWHAALDSASELVSNAPDARYRKRAEQVRDWIKAHPAEAQAQDVGPEWKPCRKRPVIVHVREQRPGEQHVSTREGITAVKPDDLIMRGVEGEEYPIGRELFAKTYDLVEAQAQGGGRVCIEAHWLENVSAAASLLEASGDVFNVREAAALRKLIASAERTAPPSAPVGVEAEDAAAIDKAWGRFKAALAQQPSVAPVGVEGKHVETLRKVIGLLRDTAVLQGREHISLGIAFTDAIDYFAALAQQPESDGGFSAADMMDARQEGRKEAQQPAAVDGVAEAFEDYHSADHRDPAVASEWRWWQAGWYAALTAQQGGHSDD